MRLKKKRILQCSNKCYNNRPLESEANNSEDVAEIKHGRRRRKKHKKKVHHRDPSEIKEIKL